jgi:tRNA A37 threonylcarbamoyladenosine dehydratase
MSTSSPDERFGGIARLYGTEALARFQSAHVAVVGIGGVGSWAAEALARTGIGKITLVDLDDLCLTNTNRQIHATTGTVGKPKVEVMAGRIREINPDCEVLARQEFYRVGDAGGLVSAGLDAVIDAIDAVGPKCCLIARCREAGIPVVVSGGAGGRRDPGRITTADLARTHGDALLNQVRKRLRSDHGFPSGDGKQVSFGVPAVFSSERPVFPQSDGCVSEVRPEDLPAGLRCDAGFGTATHLTATFAFHATAALIEGLLAAGHKKGDPSGSPSKSMDSNDS